VCTTYPLISFWSKEFEAYTGEAFWIQVYMVFRVLQILNQLECLDSGFTEITPHRVHNLSIKFLLEGIWSLHRRDPFEFKSTWFLERCRFPTRVSGLWVYWNNPTLNKVLQSPTIVRIAADRPSMKSWNQTVIFLSTTCVLFKLDFIISLGIDLEAFCCCWWSYQKKESL
jgi:hypothetical protein